MKNQAAKVFADINEGKAGWRRLKHILADALEESSPEAAAASLRQLCAGDATLLKQAEELLSFDTFSFEQFAEFASDRLGGDERSRVGERLGAYVVERLIGRGGMGTVYLAARADGQFQKQVAVKILKRGTDTDEVLRRFRMERQILAALEHPNITRLLDAGSTDDGLPYFVMEFADGIPITDFAEREKMARTDRLALFLKVCSAVAVAHREQIIHRDIKPANVLVREDGEPKLLDFGIAKLVNAAENSTSVVERRFTPEYASPEQLDGKPITARSDIYSLGALLSELLIGRSHTAAVTAERRPNLARGGRSLPDDLPTELGNIIAKAMEKEPFARYSSVTELSQDIKTFLKDGIGKRSSLLGSFVHSRLLHGSFSFWYISASAAALLSLLAAALVIKSGAVFREANKAMVAGPGRAPSAAGPIYSIAVLPFQPLGQDANNDLLGLGMADAVISRMSNVQQLSVLPTSAIFRYNGMSIDPLAAGRSLQVDAVLSGTVQRMGDRVRVTVQLVPVAGGRTIWSEKFDETFTDIFGIQDIISENVTRSLARGIDTAGQKQLEKRYRASTAAYESYIMGLYFWNKRSKDGLERAVDYFKEAIEKDPKYALAYGLLSDCYYLQLDYRYASAEETIPKAKAAAERALLLDDSVAEAHVAKAMVQICEKNKTGATISLEQALKLNPNLAIAHERYGWLLCEEGKLSRAIEEIRRAQKLDPLSPLNNRALGYVLALSRQFAESLQYCFRAAELQPDDYVSQCSVGFAYQLNGRFREAIDHFQRAMVLKPENKGSALTYIAITLIAAGREAEAKRLSTEIISLAEIGKVEPYDMAMFYASSGNKDLALEWLGRASYNNLSMAALRYDALLDPLRADSRFDALLHRRVSMRD